MTRFSNLVLAAIVLCTTGGSAFADNRPVEVDLPAGPVRMMGAAAHDVTYLNRREQTPIIIGREIVVRLRDRGGRSDGYRWEVEKIVGLRIRQISKINYHESRGRKSEGDNGTYVARFVIDGPGMATISMKYHKPGLKKRPDSMAAFAMFNFKPKHDVRQIAANRAEKLKRDVKNFRLAMVGFRPRDFKHPYRTLELSVPKIEKEKASSRKVQYQITAEKAKRIIDFLATTGWLGLAYENTDVPMVGFQPPPVGRPHVLPEEKPCDLAQAPTHRIVIASSHDSLASPLRGSVGCPGPRAWVVIAGLLDLLEADPQDYLEEMAFARAQAIAIPGQQGVTGRVTTRSGSPALWIGTADEPMSHAEIEKKSTMKRRKGLFVPVHVFKGVVKPFEKFDLKHSQLIKTVHCDKQGRYYLRLEPGQYTVVAEIDGKMFHCRFIGAGSEQRGCWEPIKVERDRWTISDICKITKP